jgi:hypothetical protein
MNVCLEQEEELRRLNDTVDICCPDPDVIVKMNKKMLPCILHLEMRCGIKFLRMILSEGLSRPANRKAQDAFVIEIEMSCI